MFSRALGTVLRSGAGRSRLPGLRPAAAVLHPRLGPTHAQPLGFCFRPGASMSLRVRNFSSSAASCASNSELVPEPPAPSASNSELVPEPRVDLKQLGVDGVVQFAMTHGLNAKDAGILKAQEIDGRELLMVTEEKLVRLYGMLGGPAGDLVDAVKAQTVPLAHGKKAWLRTFANREREVARLFALNVRNNWEDGYPEYPSYTVPISSHLYGAGKTALGQVYTAQLRTETVEKEIMRELKEMGSEIESYGKDQLKVMRGVVREVHVNAGSTAEEALRNLSTGLDELLVVKIREEHWEATCKMQLAQLRQLGPVFLAIDEIGGLGYAELRLLRDSLARLYFACESRHPLHIYLCGKADESDLNNSLILRGKGGSQPAAGHGQITAKEYVYPCLSRQELLLLQPLGTDHIKTIAEEDFGLSLPDEVGGEVENVTGGVPRMIRYMLKELKKRAEASSESLTPEVVRVSCAAVTSVKKAFVRMDRDLLIDFARCFAYQERRSTVKIDRDNPEDSRFLAMLGQLPVLADLQKDGTHTVRCCPLYLSHYKEQMFQPDFFRALTGRGRRPVMDRGDQWESEVLDRLQTNLMLPLLTARQPEAGAVAGMPVETSLEEWLPSLFKKGEQANRLESALQDLSLGKCLTRSLPVYFGHVDLKKKVMKKEEKDEEKKEEVEEKEKEKPTVTPTIMWKMIEERLDNEGKREDAAVILMPVPASCSPDVLVRLPATHSLQLLSFQVKSSKKEGAVKGALFGISDIATEANKLPTDMPEGSRKLLVVCADAVTQELEGAVGGGQFLVLSNMEGKGQVHDGKSAQSAEGGSNKFSQEKKEKKVKKGKEEKTDTQTSQKTMTVQEKLQAEADKLPAGAIVAVMAPDLFRKFAPKSPL